MAQTSFSGRCLCAQGSGNGVAHGSGAAGVDPRTRVLKVHELRGPHLVLAHTGTVDRFWPHGFAELFQDELRVQQAIIGGLITAREALLHAAQVIVPLFHLSGRLHGLLAVFLAKSGQALLRIADDGDRYFSNLANLSGVNIGVDDLRIGCESGKEPRAIKVVTTGIFVSSANSSSSWEALTFMTPPPT